jgi:hypothetical protein
LKGYCFCNCLSSFAVCFTVTIIFLGIRKDNEY